jgi:quercetin dioxygenase-like cupin family protein
MLLLRVPVAFKDDRGEIIDLLENEVINAVTIVTFQADAIRGNHYHKLTTQWNYVMKGRIALYTQLGAGGVVEKNILQAGDLARVEPNERHALVGIEDAVVMVFTRGPRGGKEYETDTFRLEQPLVS